MPSPVKYRIIHQMLTSNGWRLDRVKGSHHTYTDGSQNYTFPVHHNEVKVVYVKEIKKILGV
jgi:predicted RNA binding protein YcfA (HicA-like mRNA interferase family)